jgi:hypothetical protein
MRVLCLALILCAAASAQQPATALTAEQIMARVAANQDRSNAARRHFVYLQHARVFSRKGKTMMCDEETDTRVAPDEKGQTQTLLHLDGHVRTKHGQVIAYDALPLDTAQAAAARAAATGKQSDDNDGEYVRDREHGHQLVSVPDTDIDLVENMRTNFTHDKKAKDGIEQGLFPLTTEQQKDMVFELRGREPRNGHDCYHIYFRPRDKDDFGWKGDAWIDATAFEPVLIRTAMARGIPLGVKLLLGTNVPGLGFAVTYAPQPAAAEDAVWFPQTLSSEFKIDVLYFFHRTIVVSVEDRDFEQTHVRTTIVDPAVPPAVEAHR